MISSVIEAFTWVAQADTPPQAPINPMILMIGVIFIFFWLIILRPQKREQAAREKMIDELGRGDQVLTSGGIIGTVESVDKAKGTITLSVAPKVSIKFSRAAVASVVEKKGAKDKAEPEEKK